MMRLPEIVTGSEYYTCCGKIICSGCGHAPVYDHLGNIGTGERKSVPFVEVHFILQSKGCRNVWRLVMSEQCLNLDVVTVKDIET